MQWHLVLCHPGPPSHPYLPPHSDPTLECAPLCPHWVVALLPPPLGATDKERGEYCCHHCQCWKGTPPLHPPIHYSPLLQWHPPWGAWRTRCHYHHLLWRALPLPPLVTTPTMSHSP